MTTVNLFVSLQIEFGVSKLAKKKTDVSSARDLIASMGPVGLSPSEAILTGATALPGSSNYAHDAHNAHDAHGSNCVKTKRKSINMAFTDDNIENMRIASGALGISQTEFTNRVLREWFESHESELAAFKSASAAFGR